MRVFVVDHFARDVLKGPDPVPVTGQTIERQSHTPGDRWAYIQLLVVEFRLEALSVSVTPARDSNNGGKAENDSQRERNLFFAQQFGTSFHEIRFAACL